MLQTLLAEGRPLLADGATGTNLFAMGLAAGETPELWNAAHPDRIKALHQAFVDAGADIILTNSFGGNRRRLALHGLEARARSSTGSPLRTPARSPTRRAGASSSRDRSGPTGDIFAPLGPLDRGRGGRGLRRADRGLEARRRGRRLDRDHVRRRGNSRGRARRGEGRHAVHHHRELRHRRPHDDGGRAGRARRARRGFRSEALGLWARIAASARPIFLSRSSP